MYEFGSKSLKLLESADPRWEEILTEVLRFMNISIICTHRNKEDQDEAVRTGKSKTPWPTSKHNSLPSIAVDIVPYPIDWADTKRFGYMAGLVISIAANKGYKVRWGGDWDRDGNTKNQTFHDLPHFELV